MSKYELKNITSIRFKEVLEKSNLMNKEVASHLHYSANAISDLRNGKSKIPYETAKKICELANSKITPIEINGLLVTNYFRPEWLCGMDDYKTIESYSSSQELSKIDIPIVEKYIIPANMPTYLSFSYNEETNNFTVSNKRTKRKCTATLNQINKLHDYLKESETNIINFFMYICNISNVKEGEINE